MYINTTYIYVMCSGLLFGAGNTKFSLVDAGHPPEQTSFLCPLL